MCRWLDKPRPSLSGPRGVGRDVVAVRVSQSQTPLFAYVVDHGWSLSEGHDVVKNIPVVIQNRPYFGLSQLDHFRSDSIRPRGSAMVYGGAIGAGRSRHSNG